MSFLNSITSLVKDPGPSHMFELSEAGVAYAHAGQYGFQPLEPGTLVASPSADNLLRPDLLSSVIGRVAPAVNGSKKKRLAAVILPDYAVRVTVIDFDSFPTAPEEQLPLVKFRVKKTIPFDIESAAVSYYVQPVPGSKRTEVVAVTVAFEVVARYEALFRSAGFQPGEITSSTLAALNLYKGEGVAILAKLSGSVLTVTVIAGNTIKLFRCVTVEDSSEEEILSILHPTLAYAEDELASPVRKLFMCGLPEGILDKLKCETEPLRSRFGTPGAYNAGLLGYLEGAAN
jgi:type IV pilus assembly protein PilM